MNILNGVEDTLFIPLNARIYVSKKFPSFFYDKKALELWEEISSKKINNKIINKSSEYQMLTSCVRYHRTDNEIKKFCSRFSISNIIFLGAGLETAYYRLNDKVNNFYEIDLENVMNYRQKYLGFSENDTLISGDMFKLNWINKINTSLPTIIIVNGVFHYFTEEKIINFINQISSNFKNELEIIFDTTSKSGLKIANKYVNKTGNKSALMKFYVNNSNDFVKKLNNAILIKEYPFFDSVIDNIKDRLKFKTKLSMCFADKLKLLKIIHINLRSDK